MPSRRKSAHTTKIERVPRFEVYHGEEDIDDRLSSDGTLDLSMKRVKVEPVDYSETREASPTHSRRSAASETDTASGEIHEAAIDAEEQEEGSASSCGQKETSSVADDSTADASSTSDHVSVPIDVPSSTVDSATDERLIVDSNAPAVTTTNGLQLFAQTAKGKTVRPFKLYTATNRDLLSGLSTQGAPTLATYPIALAAVPGSVGTVPLAFTSVPLVSGAPMIPQTAASSSTSATSSAAAMGADTDTITSSTSSPTSNTTAKSTSSTTDAHLMTLATEADKILRERHASGESSTGTGQDSMEGNTAETLTSNGTEDHDSAMASEAEEGTVLKIPLVSSQTSNGDEDSLSFIQKRAVAAAVAASTPHKSKKKRQPLPDQMKDLAYWERRRKNNEAAKRSRDARRAKEDQIAIRAALLEQENIRLKIEVNALKEETAKLRSMLYANNNK